MITKFDLYLAGMQRRLRNKSTYQMAEDDFKKKYGHKFSKNNISTTQIPYALVSSMFIPGSLLRRLHWHHIESQFETFQGLVQITRQSISASTPGASSGYARGKNTLFNGTSEIIYFT